MELEEIDRRPRVDLDLGLDLVALHEPVMVEVRNTRSAGRPSSSSPAATTSANGAATTTSSGRRSASAAMRPIAESARYEVSRGDAKGVTARERRPRPRRWNRFERLPDDVLAAAALHPELRLEQEPVRERGHGDRLDVVGRDEVASCEGGPAARELQQRQASARARADREARARPRGGDDVDHVTADRWLDVHELDRGLHREQGRAVDHLGQHDVVLLPLDPAGEHLPLGLRIRIAEAGAEQEAIELRLRERVGALVLDRVLGREHQEGALERAGQPVRGHLPLLHRLEQRRLCLRRSAVDLVGEEEMREDRARPELEVAVPLVPDRRPRDVSGEEIRRELDAAEAEPARLCERSRREGLREPRHVLEENVAVGEEPEQDELELLTLADDGALDLVEQPGAEIGDLA